MSATRNCSALRPISNRMALTQGGPCPYKGCSGIVSRFPEKDKVMLFTPTLAFVCDTCQQVSRDFVEGSSQFPGAGGNGQIIDV
eukprot:g4538.t1